MDGAIILAKDASRIARANVHLVPDPTVPTSETGTRHRTAERVARHLRHVPVVSVSEEMSVLTVYVGDSKHVLQEIPRLLDKASQALQTWGATRPASTKAIASLSALEVEDLVTLRDVATVVQRSETVRRIAEEIETMIIELGVDARLLRLQFEELYGDTDTDLELVLRDYLAERFDLGRERCPRTTGRTRRRRSARSARRCRRAAARGHHRPRPSAPAARLPAAHRAARG